MLFRGLDTRLVPIASQLNEFEVPHFATLPKPFAYLHASSDSDPKSSLDLVFLDDYLYA